MNEQTEHWKGRFGDQYIDRNKSEDLLASYTAMWAKILAKTEGVNSALEIGANVGLNLDAISRLRPGVHCEAIETNELACRQLQRKGYVAHNIAAQETWDAIVQYDLVFTRGVLIHVEPAYLPDVYKKMVGATSRYIVVAEYFAPQVEMIPYRGEMNRLWRNDFAADIMSRHHNLRLVDYGFIWKYDPTFSQDNITWFLMEKK